MADGDHTDTDKVLLEVSKKYIQVTGGTVEEFVLTLSEIASQAVSNSFDSCLSQTVNVA